MSSDYTWTDEKALQYIHDLADEDGPPTKKEFRQEADIQLGVITNRFGGWEEALEAAGYAQHVEEYTREELLSLVTEIATDGEPPTLEEFTSHPDAPSQMPIYNRFDSWNEFLDAAGFDVPEKSGAKYTKQDLINQIQLVGEDLGGKRPTEKEFTAHAETTNSTVVYDYFGSWKDAVEAAGYDRHHHTQYTRDELIDIITEFEDRAEKCTARAFDADPDTPSTMVIRNKFGSWAIALDEAGIDHNLPSWYSRDELLSAITDLVDEVGQTPRTTDLKQSCIGPKSISPFRKEFGSWNEALEAAGFDPTVQQYSREELIAAIETVAEDNGGRVSYSAYRNHPGTPSLKPVRNEFGSLREACEEIDTEYAYESRHPKYTKRELTDAIAKAASSVDGRLTTTEYRDWADTHDTAPVLSTITDRFGDWESALQTV